MEIVSTNVAPTERNSLVVKERNTHDETCTDISAPILVIPVPSIAIVTVTDGLHGLVIQVAGLCVAVATGPGAWTQTLPARNLVLSELRRPIEANLGTFMCGQEKMKSRT